MSIDSYLTQIASHAVVRDQHRESIASTTACLRTRLDAYFCGVLSKHSVFGSYSRGTWLPRSMDPHSAVDYMVVFKDTRLQPQDFLKQLCCFAESYYSQSKIEKRESTLVVSHNNVRLRLVPAKEVRCSGLHVLAKVANCHSWDWVQTDPKGFHDDLAVIDRANKNLVKPLVRILKYWNAQAGYPFEPYELEREVAGVDYGFFGLRPARQVSTCFFLVVDSLRAGLCAPKWKAQAVSYLKQVVSEARAWEASEKFSQAEVALHQLLPRAVLLDHKPV